MRIAVISVAISIAVMIVSLAVIMGFKGEVSRKIIGFTAHTLVTDISDARTSGTAPIIRSTHTDSVIRSAGGVKSISEFAIKGGIIKTDEAMQGVVLKGVAADYDMSFFEQVLIDGTMPRIGDSVRTKDILISRTLADKMLLGIDAKVEMLFVDSGESPRRDRFKVSGIFSSGMDEMDNAVIITDIRNVQRLANWDENQISGYEINTTDESDIKGFTRSISRALIYDDSEQTQNLIAKSVYDQYPNIFDWLKAHDVNAVVIIVIMLIVAFFNMASALLIIVLERTKMIGILKAMGMNNTAIRRIFLFRASFITLKGLLWGNLIGVGLALLQSYFHIIKLSSEGYLLSEVPIDLSWSWWLILNAGVVAAIVILLIIPTYIISYIRPDESMRYSE